MYPKFLERIAYLIEQGKGIGFRFGKRYGVVSPLFKISASICFPSQIRRASRSKTLCFSMERSWNFLFRRDLNDWEIDQMANLLHRLGESQISLAE